MMPPLVTTVMDPDVITDNALCAWIGEVFHLTDHISFVVGCVYPADSGSGLGF